jgi:hypothetical protein
MDWKRWFLAGPFGYFSGDGERRHSGESIAKINRLVKQKVKKQICSLHSVISPKKFAARSCAAL